MTSDRLLSKSALRVFLPILTFKMVLLFYVLPKISAISGSSYGLDRFSDGYEMLAISLVEGHGYRFLPDTSPTLMREPGYPLLLALLFALFGYGLTVVKIANVILACVAAYLMMLICRRNDRGNNRYIEIIAPSLFLLHPGVLIAESRGGYEIVFIVFLLLFLLLLYDAVRANRTRLYLAAGAVMGLAILVKSTLVLFPFFVFLYLVTVERRNVSIAAAARNAGALFLAAAVVMSPWVVRNYLVSGKFVPTASVFGVAAYTGAYICKNLTFNDRMQSVDIRAAQTLTDRARDEGYHFTGDYYRFFYSVDEELEFNSKIAREVRDEFVRSPGLFMKCATQNVFKFWLAGKSWTATALNAVIQLPYILLGVIGFVMGVKKAEWRMVGLPALLVLYYMAVHVTIHAQARYSIPVIPALALLAAIPLSSVLRRKYI